MPWLKTRVTRGGLTVCIPVGQFASSNTLATHTTMPFKYPSLIDRIIANTVLATDSEYKGSWCWLWTGSRNSAGYGVITMRRKTGVKKGTVKRALVHRVVVKDIKGRSLTKRNVVLHLCNNPLCCNPDHLAGGTQKQNMKQCVREGRHGNSTRAPVREMERNTS